jgi:hypothetical protein
MRHADTETISCCRYFRCNVCKAATPESEPKAGNEIESAELKLGSSLEVKAEVKASEPAAGGAGAPVARDDAPAEKARVEQLSGELLVAHRELAAYKDRAETLASENSVW